MKKKLISLIITIIFLALIILYTYPLIGLWGQVKSTSYPDDYFQANEFLKQQNITGHIIYLPWQTYLTYNWTLNVSRDGRIANPINKIVEPLVITGPDQYGSYNDMQLKIENCLNDNSIECLENISVQYIIKDKCTFYYTEYEWINNSVFNTSCINIIKINNKNIIEQPKIPLRFIIGTSISIITLVILIYFLIINKNYHRL